MLFYRQFMGGAERKRICPKRRMSQAKIKRLFCCIPEKRDKEDRQQQPIQNLRNMMLETELLLVNRMNDSKYHRSLECSQLSKPITIKSESVAGDIVSRSRPCSACGLD
jgi:hypothetical protein